MKLQDVMTRAVETISASESAERAWQRMRAGRIHHLVVTADREVIGVVSARDLGGLEAMRLRPFYRVADVMATRPVLGHPRMTVREAANLIRGRGVGCLPVLEGSRLVGIVTVSDLLELLGRGLERPVVRAERRILSRRQDGRTARVRTPLRK